MNKAFLLLMGCISNHAYATDDLLKFRADQPDLVIQMALGEDQKNFYFNQFRETLKTVKGIDILDGKLKLNPMEPIKSGIALEEYIDKKLVKILKQALRFDLKQVSSTLDIYKMSYKLGPPSIQLVSSVQTENSIDLTLSFKFKKLEIDVENIYLNNHSPGVTVTPQDEQGVMRVTGKENMTFIDDIYLKLVSPEDKPILEIETFKNEPDVVSGQIQIRIHQNQDQSMRLEYLNHDVQLFESKDAQSIADRIKIFLGKESKIGGLDAIEFGKAELKFKDNLNAVILRKKISLINLIADQLTEASMSEKTTEYLKSQIDPVMIDGSIYKNLGIHRLNNDLAIQTQVNTIGFIDADTALPQFHLSTNQSVSWLSPIFQTPEELPFPLSNPDHYPFSLEQITQNIRSGHSDLMISLGQDFINESIRTITQGSIQLPNDPTTKKDDAIFNGKKGIFLMLDDPTAQQGKVVVDVLIKPKFFKSLGLAIATFKSKLYFPLVIIPELKMEMHENIPQLVLMVKDFDLSDETLKNGTYCVESNLNKGINRKLVLNKIRKILHPMIGTTIKSIPIPQLEGIDLGSMTELTSDGHGRLNLNLKLNSEFPKIIQNWIKTK